MKQFKVVQGKQEISSTAGNLIAGKIFRNAAAAFPENLQSRRSDAISDRDIISTVIAMSVNSRTDFTNVNLYKKDTVTMSSFGINRLPSEETLRLRLDEFAPNLTQSKLDGINQSILENKEFSRVKAGSFELVPVDIDVSPLDNSGSNKGGVSYTYKGHDGFAPIFAYIGSEGYMLNHELRPGSQHCQLNTPAFIQDCSNKITALGLDSKCLIRLDSGNDAQENFSCFGSNYFIVKRNLRKEKLEQWLANGRRLGELKENTREGKNVYVGFVDHKCPGGESSKMDSVSIAFEITERLEDQDGHPLIIPEIEVNTFWTNLPCEAQEVVELYKDHGTSEQFHSELKSDMNVEQLPSGKFGVNQIVLYCAMIAFNILRSIGQEVIKHAELAPITIKVKRWRLKTVLQNIIYSGARVVRHAGAMQLQFGKNCQWFNTIKHLAKT